MSPFPRELGWFTACVFSAAVSAALILLLREGAPPVTELVVFGLLVSRYARPQGARPLHRLTELLDLPADFDVGLMRARAGALLMLALPGGAYVYQGEELGLPEVEDLPDEVLQDPTWEQSDRTDRGRDGCRVPIPWSGDEPSFGFSPEGAGAPPWLPQPHSWAALTVESQTGDDASTLELSSRALKKFFIRSGTRSGGRVMKSRSTPASCSPAAARFSKACPRSRSRYSTCPSGADVLPAWVGWPTT